MNPSSFVLGLAFPLLVRSTIKRKALLRFLPFSGDLSMSEMELGGDKQTQKHSFALCLS